MTPSSLRFVFLCLCTAFLSGFLFSLPAQAQSDLVLTGVIDGPLTGGTPKAVELYVLNDVADLSLYGLGSANNGGGTDGEEFTFPAVAATAGDFIYVATEATQFANWFGFAPDYTDGSATNINGDDAIELFMNGSVVDVFGDINTDGSGQPWEYLDGWAYRVNDTGPDGSTFVLSNWMFSGPNALDGETSNATAETPFPVGSYSAGGMASLSLTTVVDRADEVCTDPDDIETCDLSGSSSSVTAAPGEKLVVRYTAENTGDVTLTTHDLVDSAEGVLFSNLSFDIAPGASVRIDNFSTAPGMTGTTTRSATWTADDGEPTEASDTDTYEITVAEPDTSCPTDLVISDFLTAPDDEEFVDLTNVGTTDIDFSEVECALGGFRADAYVSLPPEGVLAAGQTLRFGSEDTGPDVVIPDGTLVDAYAALALLDLPEFPMGQPTASVADDVITSLVYLNDPSMERGTPAGARAGATLAPSFGVAEGSTVFGFYHVDPEHEQLYCSLYGDRLHFYATTLCFTSVRGGSASERSAPPMDLNEMIAAALAEEVRVAGLDLAASSEALPEAFGLGGAYPNPVSRAATITVELPEDAAVRVAVYDVLGRTVAVLADGEFAAGRHAVTLDASRLAAGTYVVRMTADSFVQAQRLTVVR